MASHDSGFFCCLEHLLVIICSFLHSLFLLVSHDSGFLTEYLLVTICSLLHSLKNLFFMWLNHEHEIYKMTEITSSLVSCYPRDLLLLQ